MRNPTQTTATFDSRTYNNRVPFTIRVEFKQGNRSCCIVIFFVGIFWSISKRFFSENFKKLNLL